MMNNKSGSVIVLSVLIILAIAAGIGGWYELVRPTPQPAWIAATPRTEFLYGSVAQEASAGIPYWIWLVLPRIFPEYMPGEGGYASLGFSWEETIEMPAGFSKKSVGYVRVAGNCALCHAYSQSNGPDAAPTVFAAGPGHTAEYQKLLLFYKRCAQDSRFNADDILSEVDMATKLSFIDRLIYRYILIPRTREQLLGQSPVLFDAALLRHSADPASGASFRKQMQTLEGGLSGAEKDALSAYLKAIPQR